MAHDTTRETRRARCPESVLSWIPWYADGGLGERERGAVEAHAAECRACREELDIVAGEPWAFEGIALPDADALFGEIEARIAAEVRDEPAMVIPIERGRALADEDLARIERWVLDPGSERDEAPADDGGAGDARSGDAAVREEPVEPTRARRGIPARSRGARRSPPLRVAAAALVLLAIGGLGGGLLERLVLDSSGETTGAPELAAYQLASAPPADRGTASAPRLDVVFSDSISAREISTTLRALGVEIVSGPTNLGVYRLQLLPAATEGRAPGPADAAAIAAQLVAPESKVAIFAEPVP